MKIKTLVEALLVVIIARLVLKGASIGDSFVCLGLLGHMGYSAFLAKQEVKDPTVELSERIKLIEDRSQKTEQKLVAITAFGRGK